MLARLNMNEIPIFKWKGKTFQQITSNIQMNTNSNTSMYNLRMAQPLKIYRREIASKPIQTCSQKHVRFDEMNTPNGYIISTASTQNGLKETLDFNYVNNSTEHPRTCYSLSSTAVCLNPAKNALNRVRSSGIIKRHFNANANNDTYYTSTKQYLESRNRTFSQNQFNYIREGNPNAQPGSPASADNIYTPHGLNHCAKSLTSQPYVPLYYKPNNSQYAQQGAVTASSKITRLKYNTMTTNAMKMRTSYGNAVANASAYGGSDNIYTLKAKTGYPNICSPVIDKYSGKLKMNTCVTK